MIKNSENTVTQQSKFWIVLPAAGIGSRMQSLIPKQYLNIDGYPVITHTISQLLQHSQIAGVMVVISDQDSVWQSIYDAYKTNNKLNNPANRLKFCVGGKTRMDSVLAGLNAVAGEVQPQQWILVHDAARPGINLNTMDKFVCKLNSAATVDGYVLAQPCTDTLKICNAEGDIKSTLDRNKIWAAQTPQAFKFQSLLDCLQTFKQQKNSNPITDESSAMEKTAAKIKLVSGNNGNFKITTTDDISRMEFEITAQLENTERVHPQQFFNPIAKLEEKIL